MITGTRDFTGGQTLRERVNASDARILAKCSGYKAEDSALVGDALCDDVTITVAIEAGGLPLASQTPVVVTHGATSKIIARDKNNKVRVLSGGVWGAAGPSCPVVPESGYVRLGSDQVILPTKGSDAKLMVYEPQAGAIRPLAFKSPLNYSESEKPTVTPSADASLQLFDCDDAEADWAAVEEGVVCTTSGDSVSIAIDSTADKNSVLAKKDLGATGVSPVGKTYFVLDIAIENDEQDYTYAGLFPNDPLMAPSGYIFEMYSDQACTSLVSSFYLPQCTQQGLVYRIAVNIGTLATTIKGVAIKTTAFWTIPASGSTYTIKMWSEAAQADWSHKGNLLLPAVKWNKGEWADILSVEGQSTEGYLDVAPSGNVLTHGGFELGTGEVATGWTRNGGGGTMGRSETASRTGSCGYYMNGDTTSDRTLTSNYHIPVDANREYTFELYRRTAWDDRHWKVSIACYSAADALLNTFLFPGTGYYAEDGADTWQRFKSQFQTPATTTYCLIVITGKDDSTTGDHNIWFDDVMLYASNQASSNCAYVLQTFSQNGVEASKNPMVQFAYCHLGKDRLSTELYNLMISNPSLGSSPVTFADPWKTYTVAIALPDDANGNNVIDDYGSYVTHALVYRRLYDGATQTWDEWTFIQAVSIATTMEIVSTGTVADPLINGMVVPEIMETNNDYLASARHVCYQNGRVRAFTLNWSEADGEWKYVLGEAISSEGKPWAFPTGVAQELLATDGTWSEIRPITGSEIRGCLATTDDVYVFLDNEFGIERGNDPQTGFRFIRVDSIGLASERSLANCRGVPIGLAPDGYFYAYSLSNTQPISKGIIDGSKIDLTKPHDAVFAGDRYVFLCEYNDAMSLLIMSITNGSWRVRTSTAFTGLVGLASDGQTVYGLDSTGAVYDVFGGTGIAADLVREVHTQWIQVMASGYDAQVRGLHVTATDFTAGQTLTFTLQGVGKKQTAVFSRTLTLVSGQSNYFLGCAFLAEAVQVKMTYEGTDPPTIHELRIVPDEEPVR